MTYIEAYKRCIELQHESRDDKTREALGVAINCIEMCDILLPAWQSPERVLPENGEKVIAVAKSNSGSIIDTAFYEKECWVFHDWKAPQEDVIAWMKLPIFNENYVKGG